MTNNNILACISRNNGFLKDFMEHIQLFHLLSVTDTITISLHFFSGWEERSLHIEKHKF